MKNLFLLVALLLVAWPGAAQRYPAAPAAAFFTTNRGQFFNLTLDGQRLTRGPVPELRLANLAPGQHWAEFGLGSGPGGNLRLRVSLWLEPGLETRFVLSARPGRTPVLRQAGAVPLPPVGGYPNGDNDDGYADDQYPNNYPNPNNGGYYPMTPPDVAALVQALQSRSFDSGRLDIARQALSHSAIFADDFRAVLATFDFDAARTELATFGYPHVADRQNFYRVYDTFDFDSSVRQVQQATAD